MDAKADQRFHMPAEQRLEAFAVTAGLVGAFSGFYQGIKMSSVRFLTENGHRLPQTVGGWYFYHKKKNYVMITQGIKQAVSTGAKYSLAVGSFFGLEATLDHVRGTIDCFNTMASGMACSGGYAAYHQFSSRQARKYIIRGGVIGLCLGLAQDMLRYARGGNVWYLQELGVKRPQTQSSVQPSIK